MLYSRVNQTSEFDDRASSDSPFKLNRPAKRGCPPCRQKMLKKRDGVKFSIILQKSSDFLHFRSSVCTLPYPNEPAHDRFVSLTGDGTPPLATPGRCPAPASPGSSSTKSEFLRLDILRHFPRTGQEQADGVLPPPEEFFRLYAQRRLRRP